MALTTYTELKTEFLSTFRLQPTAAHILNSLSNLRQNRRSVYAYAAEIRKLVNRLAAPDKPSDLVQCETFLRDLDHNDPHIGMDLSGQTLDTLVERVVKADRLKAPITQSYGPAVAGSRVAYLPQGSRYGYPPAAWNFQGATSLDAQRGVGSATAVDGPAESGSGLVFRPDVWCTSYGK